MSIKLKPTMPDFARIMSAQQSVIASVFSTTARINEAELQRQGNDRLTEILEAMRKAEQEMEVIETIQ